jgi:uncharacterized protein (TIGR01244 family)
MSAFRFVTDAFAVSVQIFVADMAEIHAEGFTRVINNRPDGEAPGQPTAAEIEAAALSEGLTSVHIPIVGRPTPDQAAAMLAATANGRTLAYCRTGMRSIVAWAMGELQSGARSRDDILRLVAVAGYDLENVLPRANGPLGRAGSSD